MLSSTAKNLYWMGRYLQRAKTTARLIEATQRMALQSSGEEAEGVVGDLRHGGRVPRQPDAAAAAAAEPGRPAGSPTWSTSWPSTRPTRPRSSRSIGQARRNAREERNNITVDVWESLNGLWLELSAKLRGNRASLDRGALIESVKKQAVMIFGAAQVTLLRDEAYNFFQLGAFLERGDNTARILDVKYHRLMPDGRPHAEQLDYFAWSEVLACIGAVRTYRRIYRSSLDPMKIAELMMLRRDVPRSVHHCLWMVDLNMRELADAYGTRGEADRLAGELHARLRYARIDQDLRDRPAQVPGRRARRHRHARPTTIGRQFLLD